MRHMALDYMESSGNRLRPITLHHSIKQLQISTHFGSMTIYLLSYWFSMLYVYITCYMHSGRKRLESMLGKTGEEDQMMNG
jgi:hypothetical protein